MKRLLNTLYVFTEGAVLNKERETVHVTVKRETKAKIPLITLSSIVCFGETVMTAELMHHCAATGITVTWLGYNGKFLARVEGPVSGNVLLRRAQYRAADNSATTALLARTIVAAKVSNSKTVLRRFVRDYPDDPEAGPVGQVADKLSYLADKVLLQQDPDVIRGIEGEAAALYFSVFNSLIRTEERGFVFTGRNRRPPTDRVNALLSFLYTLLTHEMRSACESAGLDPAVGYLHRDRPGRPGLALDLMEEFRASVVDRLVLSLINRQQVKEADFDDSLNGAVLLKDDARKVVVTAWQERKQNEVTHPFLKETMHLGIAMRCQAQLLARFLRGDMDGYPPFFWR